MKIFIGCTSNNNVNDTYKNEVDKISKVLSKDYDLIIGGTNDNGIFSVLINNFKNIELVTLPIYKEDVIDKIKVSYVDSTFDRTKTIYNMADKILILPGGTGTICEIFSILEESRTFDKKDIIIFNLDNYYTDIIKMISKSIKNDFNKNSILDYIKVFNNSDDLIRYLGG